MVPAFSSPRQAGAFFLLIFVLLALPAMLPKLVRLDRRDVYPSFTVTNGPFSWIQQKIFGETGSADVVFVGSSHMWTGIDTPYVQKRFSDTLGRDAKVFSLCFPTPGFDAEYAVARDLLEHHRVKMLVIDDEGKGGDLPHPLASRWFRIGEYSDAMNGLSVIARSRLYSYAVLGIPRQLLILVRRDFAEDLPRPTVWNTLYGAPNFPESLGAMRVRLSYVYRHNFSEFEPHGRATPDEVRVSSQDTRDSFVITGPPLAPYQSHFARKLAQLCQEHGTQLIFLNPPQITDHGQKIPEREYWPDALGMPIDMVGIPPADLFAGISERDIVRMFYSDDHMNQVGQRYFTALITPALLKLYVETSSDN